VTKDVLINERIRSKMVRLVDGEGKQVGIFLTRDAILRARNEGLDLVQMSPGDPPVCRVIDSGKYMYDRKRQLRENAKRQRELTVETKEIQLRPVTDTNDLLVKVRRAREFLDEGDKVKIVVRFRGRERAHKDIGIKVVNEFLTALGDHRIDRPLQDNGRDMHMFVSPVKTKAELLKEKQA
jgi:translation initiation factor IF-3